MKINDYALMGYLRSHDIPSILLVSGDEILLVEEVLAQLYQTFSNSGIEARQRFSLDGQFNLDALRNSLCELSLFSDKSIIELHVPAKLPVEIASFLVDYAQNPSDINKLVIKMPKLTAAEQRTKWYKALEKGGLHVPVWPIKPEKYPAWIKSRAKKKQLTITGEALAYLAERCEGNLLACDQILTKFFLLTNQKSITLTDLVGFLEDNANYDIFDLANALLRGDKPKYLRILGHLKAEAQAPTLVLWSLTKSVRQLIKLHIEGKHQSLSTLLKQHRLFGPNEQAMRLGLQTISIKQAYALLLQAFQIEKSLKGVHQECVWQRFELLIFDPLTIKTARPHLGG